MVHYSGPQCTQGSSDKNTFERHPRSSHKLVMQASCKHQPKVSPSLPLAAPSYLAPPCNCKDHKSPHTLLEWVCYCWSGTVRRNPRKPLFNPRNPKHRCAINPFLSASVPQTSKPNSPKTSVTNIDIALHSRLSSQGGGPERDIQEVGVGDGSSFFFGILTQLLRHGREGDHLVRSPWNAKPFLSEPSPLQLPSLHPTALPTSLSDAEDDWRTANLQMWRNLHLQTTIQQQQHHHRCTRQSLHCSPFSLAMSVPA